MVDSQDEWPVQATIYIDPAWPIIFLHTRAYDQFRNCRNSIYQEVFLHLIVQLNNLCEMRQGNAHNKLVHHPIWKWINFIPLIKRKKLNQLFLIFFDIMNIITFEQIKHQFALKWPEPTLLPPDFLLLLLAEKCFGHIIWVIVIWTEPKK